MDLQKEGVKNPSWRGHTEDPTVTTDNGKFLGLEDWEDHGSARELFGPVLAVTSSRPPAGGGSSPRCHLGTDGI